MVKSYPPLVFSLALLTGLCASAAHAADAPGAAPHDPCVGSAVAAAAAQPRFTLNPVRGSDERAILSWEAVPGATEYRVYREPRCPAQLRVQVAVVGGNVTTWSDSHPSPKAWYSVETTQSAGSGLARRSNPVFFDASKGSAPKSATPASPAARLPAPARAASVDVPAVRKSLLATPTPQK